MGVPNVIRTMTAEFVPEITDELLVEAAQGDERLLEIVRELGLRSAITVPLIARGRALGALSLIRDDTAPRYTELDLDLASELARRAASAVDNAILYREAERRGDASRALAHVDDGVVLLDEEGAVVSVNPAAAEILSVDSAAVVGETALGSIRAGARSRRTRGRRGATRGPVTLPLVLNDGAERWVSVSRVDFGDGCCLRAPRRDGGAASRAHAKRLCRYGLTRAADAALRGPRCGQDAAAEGRRPRL